MKSPLPPILRELTAQALDFALPRRCLFCRRPLEQEDGPLCADCERTLPALEPESPRYGVHFSRCLSPFVYVDPLRSAFHRYKFRGCWHYSVPFSRWMWEYLRRREPELPRFDLLTWTPLSRLRALRRGYDQSLRLAQGVSRYSGLTLAPTLEKYRHTAPQSGTRSAAERGVNVANVYRLRRDASVAGLRILVVDDIITTGSTLESACQVLRKAGAAELCCLTLAQTGQRTPRGEGSPEADGPP